MKRVLIVLALAALDAKPAEACLSQSQSMGIHLANQAETMKAAGRPPNEYCPFIYESEEVFPDFLGAGNSPFRPNKQASAECLALEGKPASAIAKYRELIALLELAEKVRYPVSRGAIEEVRKRIQAVDLKAPKLAIAVDWVVTGLVVRRGDEVVPFVDYGKPFMFDPQSIHVTAEAPGYKPFIVDIALMEPGVTTITIPQLESICRGNELWADGACQCTAGLVRVADKCVVAKK